MNSTAPGWVMAGTGYTPNLTSGGVDPSGAGWLRLTSTGGNQATSAYYDTAFSSTNATIYASFEYNSWGGNGADGITFFLYDGSSTFGVGANGGSLGYAQKTGVNGLNGGYLGIAMDEYGNFSNGTEGRQGGIGFTPDSFSVRGPGQGTTGYDYLGGTGTLSTSIDSATRLATPNTVQVLISATNQLTVSLTQGASSAETVLSLDLSGYARPDTLKFGFASGTGGLNNNHEIRNLNVTTLTANLWDGGAGDGLWASSNNWDPNILPAAGSDILLDNTFVSTAQTINTGSNRIVRSLLFDSPDGYTINNNTITFNAGGVPGFTGIAVTNTRGNANETINSALALANNIGIRQNSSGTLNLNGNIALGAYTAAFDGAGGTTTVTGVISGTGNVTKADAGTVNLNAANTYSGGTTVSGGTLSTNNNAGFGTGAVTLGGGTLASSNNSTVNNTIALTGNAALSNITTSGTLTQTNGSFTLNLAGATQSGTVNLSNNATGRTLTAQVDAGTSTISGVIANGGAGAGNLTKAGSGELVLSGNNTYTGTTTIGNGTLSLGASDRLADASAVNIGASGIFNLNGYSEKVGTLTATGGATINLGSTSGANTFIFGSYVPPASGVMVVNNWESSLDKLATTVASQNVSTIYLSGYGVAQEAAGLSAMGGSYGNAYLLTPVAVVEKEWDGSVSTTWSTDNNWTTPTEPATTEVALFDDLGIGRTNANMTVDDTMAGIRFGTGATVSYNLTGSGSANRTLTLAGAVPYIQQQSASNQTIAVQRITLSNNTVADITGAGNLTISSMISGTGTNLIKDGTGAGKLILSGNNSGLTGSVFINNGIVQAGNTSALGTGTTTISGGATLELSGGINPANNISVSGTGVGGNGAIRNVSGTNTLSGTTITETGATTIAADTGTTLNLTGNLAGTNTATTFAGAGNIVVARITTGTAGVTLNGSGTVTYNGTTNANTYTGLTTLNSGTLVLSKSAGTDAIGTGGLEINGGTARLGANNEQIANTATVTVNAGTFDLNGRTETIKALAGSTGSTVALGAGSLTINGSSGANDYGGAFTGTGSLNKSGTGTLNLTGSSSGMSGAVNLSGGTLKVSGTAANMLGTGTVSVTGSGNLEIQDGATLGNALTLNSTGTNGNGAVQNLTGTNTLSGNVTLSGGSRLQTDVGTLALTGSTVTLGANTLTIGGSGDASVANAISGTGGLAKDGAGTLTLSGANGYTGATAINGGTLRLSGGNNRLSDSTNVTVAGTAVFDLNNNSDTIGSLAGAGTVTMGSGSLVVSNTSGTTFSGGISGTGALTKQGAGTFTLSGANSYSGGTTVSAGTLNADHASALSTGGVTLNGGTLASTVGTTATNTVTLSGNSGLSNITTSGTLTQSGGNRTLTMTTAIQSGTVNLSESATARTLTVQVGSGTSAISGTIANGGGSTGGSLTKTGAGTLDLSGANTYNGTTTISAGVLNANNNTALGTSAVTLAGGTLASTTAAAVGNTLTLTGNSGLTNITTSGTLTQSGANRTLTLDGATQSGAVNLSESATARTLTVQVGAGTSAISGVIANGGGSNLSSLTKTGFGELVLGGANTYNGTTTISGGMVTLGGNDRLFNTSAVNIGATGTLNLAGYSDKVGTLTAANGATIDLGSTSGANTFIFGTYVPPASGVLVINNWESSLDYLGTTGATQNVSTIYISGYGVAQEDTIRSDNIYGTGVNGAYKLTPVAAPTVEWDGSTSAAWNTNANWTPAAKPTTTQIAKFGALGLGRLGVTLDGNNTIAGIQFASAATNSYNITGGFTLTLAGTVPYIQQQSASNQTIGVTTLALGANTVADITGAGNLTISSAITGAGFRLIKDGTGTGKLILSGNSTFNGGVFINNGIVQAASINALGTATATIYDGGTLELSGGFSRSNLVSVTGTGVGGNGAIRNVSGTNTLSGTITETGATTIAADTGTTLNLTGTLTGTNTTTTFAGAGNIAVARITTGTGAVVVNSTGTVTYNGTTNANTYTGLTTVNSGTLVLSKSAGTDAIGTGGLQVSGGTARLTAGNQINDTATVTVNSGTFDVNGQTETIKALAGTGGTVAIGALGTLAINGSTSTSYAGALTGTSTSSLNKSGTGTLTLTGASSGMSGAVNLSAGSIKASGTATNILGTGTVAVTGTGNLQLEGGATLTNAMSLNSTGSGSGAVQNLSGTNTLSGAVTLAGSSRLQSDAGTLALTNTVALGANTLTVGGSGNTSAAGVISGTGNLVKSDSGTLTLSGGSANTFSGTTTVNDGTLNLNKTAGVNALATAAVTVGDGIGGASSANLVLLASNQIADTTAVTLNSDGRLAVNNTFTESIASIAGTGLVDLSTSGYLTIGADNSSSTFAGSITGTGTLEKAGTGLLTFNSTISYAGTLTLSGGTLRLNGTSATIGTLNITANSTIDFAGINAGLDLTTLTIADGVTLNITNWGDMADAFFTDNWTNGGTGNAGAFDLRGTDPMNQITFTGFAANQTQWQSYDHQVTPVPEPSTYGALLLGAGLAVFGFRRFRKSGKISV